MLCDYSRSIPTTVHEQIRDHRESLTAHKFHHICKANHAKKTHINYLYSLLWKAAVKIMQYKH